MLVRSGRDVFPPGGHGPFELLSNLEPGLILDVGASNGSTSKKALRHSPGSTCHSFEPFEGNWPHFEQTVGQDKRITLHKKAVAQSAGRVPFYTKQVVQGSEGRWAKMPGYSSVGRILTKQDDERLSSSIQVEACSIDEMFPTEVITFLKIDVQGGEENVLRGAEKALAEGRIGVIFIEFSGQRPVLNLLSGFEIYDGEYLIIPNNDLEPLKDDWDLFRERRLSTGRQACSGWPKKHPASNYLDWFRAERDRIGYLQSDLVCIRPDLVSRFLR